MPNEIEIKPVYHITNKPLIIGEIITNRSAINVSKWKTEAVSNILDYWGNKIKTLSDIFYTSITLKAGETGTVTIDPDRVNNEIKIQYPNMKKDTPYMAQYFQLELFFKANERCFSGGNIPVANHSFRFSSSNSGFAIIDRR